jgi:hypothetical protein
MVINTEDIITIEWVGQEVITINDINRALKELFRAMTKVTMTATRNEDKFLLMTL